MVRRALPAPPSSSSSSSWWRESEVTLRFKIYFPSISFCRHTLMWICGGMLSAGAWSKDNTAGIAALWENTPCSHISSNRHFMLLTWGEKENKSSFYMKVTFDQTYKFFFCFASLFIINSYVFVKTWSERSVWWGWWCPARSRLQDTHSEHFQTEVSATIIFSPCDISPLPSRSSHL